MAERYSSFQSGGRMWLLQRVTAVFLLVVLAFHFFLLHFVHHADEVSFLASSARMESLSYYSLMILFLVTATFHGVNGVYNALVNQGLTGHRDQVDARRRERRADRAGNPHRERVGGHRTLLNRP